MRSPFNEIGCSKDVNRDKSWKPVQCLGEGFESIEARREYYLKLLAEKFKDPKFREIGGFPKGRDEDIFSLSDPPYFTLCPNPFIENFIKCFGRVYDPNLPYKKEPLAADISEGKNDPIYNAHSYHTKVPHKAIMRYILHYTEPGDIVVDGFSGTGMTGVAAQLCGDRVTVESLGYRVQSDGTILDAQGICISKLGRRNAILNDISPSASLIASNFNSPTNTNKFVKEANRILNEVEGECSWMYETLHTDGMTKGRVNYIVWSDVFICPGCVKEVVFWEVAVDKESGKIHSNFLCPHCNSSLTKNLMERAWITKFDAATNQTIRQAKQVPVLINYSISKRRFYKNPDSIDFALIEKIENTEIPYWFPASRLFEGGETRRNDRIGITHVHHYYTKRNLWILASLCSRCKASPQLYLLFNSQLVNLSRLNRYRPGVSFPYNPLSGTLYVGSLVSEANPFIAYQNKLGKLAAAYNQIIGNNIIGCQSSTQLAIGNDQCDYIFIDPPFGGNLAYSELNVLWEEWLKITTDRSLEAIENRSQNKTLSEYQELMANCFHEYYRILKPGRWMTVEFHNSKNSVWNAIGEALQNAGFVIADISTLDKGQGTFKQVTSGGAVKQDLIISAYKPNGGLETRFRSEAGSQEGVWDFVRTHLSILPKFPKFLQKEGRAEVIAKRQNYLLFDNMVAFHLRRGAIVPISASEFYAGLAQRFPERDGMYFLPEQVAEYDRQRMSVKEIIQLQLNVTDEASAIQWLKQQLTKKPQSVQDLTPLFMKELAGWSKHEKTLELSELLEQNFLMYDANDEVPAPIHSYLSSAFKELRNLSKTDPALVAKAKNRWYVPDARRATDLEKLREKALLKEFHIIAENKKRVKEFRIEAVRAGFKKCWDEGDYRTILAVAKKLPTNVIEEDSHLLMFTDLARMRQG